MARRPLIAALALAAILAHPASAWANVGTPLMWISATHLVLANAVIGIVEGCMLARIFRSAYPPAIGLMILANYFSAWFGYVWVIEVIRAELQFNIDNAWNWIRGLAAFSFVLTLVLEWPFVLIVLRKREHWIRDSLTGSFVVQTVSYSGLFLIYWSCSPASLYTDASVVPLHELPLPRNVLVYFIDRQNTTVKRIELGTGQTSPVYALVAPDARNILSDDPSPTNPAWRQLVVSRYRDSSNSVDTIATIAALSESQVARVGDGNDQGYGPGPFWGVGDARRLGVQTSDWSFRCGFWPNAGLVGENSRTHARIRLALETPFVIWEVRHLTQLPGDLVLFQLGPHQICLLDPATKRVAFVAFGRSPVAILSPEESADVLPDEGGVDFSTENRSSAAGGP